MNIKKDTIMNDKYIAQIEKELTILLDWMCKSCPSNADVTLDELIECSDDIYYEVIADIHLINGDVLTIRNECLRSFEAKEYMGAELESDSGDGNIIAVIHVFNPTSHLISIPLTSICWIDSYAEDIDWKSYKRQKEIESIKKK